MVFLICAKLVISDLVFLPLGDFEEGEKKEKHVFSSRKACN